MICGHVFVTRGRLEHLDCDAVVVPTDLGFSVRESSWREVLGRPGGEGGCDEFTASLRPAGWASARWGVAARHDLPRRTWFIDVATYRGNEPADDLEQLIVRLRTLLADVARSVEPGGGRPIPLVAMPVLGTAGGGFAPIRGAVIGRLLEATQEAARELSLDIVLVAREAADYAAFQDRRRTVGGSADLDADQRDAVADLARRARRGTLAVFVGAGVSMSAGLPSWRGLLDRLADETGGRPDLASDLDKAELLRLRLRLPDGNDGLGAAVARAIEGHVRYGLSHALLASLGIAHSVTTNYDTLYEEAFADANHEGLHVLPYTEPEPSVPWLVKMHGDVDHPEDIVLARSDFVGYHARSGPLGAIVQTLLMTEHLLVVGASLSDDNFLRLAYEVLQFRKVDGGTPHPFGTVLRFDVKPDERALWKDRFDFLEAKGATDAESARRIAIVLDAVAVEASRPHYVLDERYEALLPAAERDLARDARDLVRRVDGLDETASARWSWLADALGRHGGVPTRACLLNP